MNLILYLKDDEQMRIFNWLKSRKCNHDYTIKNIYTIHTERTGSKIICIYKCNKCGKIIKVD